MVCRAEESLLLRTAFFPSGDKLIAAAKDGTLHLWETKSRRRLPPLIGHSNEVTALDALDINQLTPVEALTKLYELQRSVAATRGR